MLDLLISYFNLILISLNYIIKKLAFQPPDPPGYILQKVSNKNEIYFIVQNGKEIKYEKQILKFCNLEYVQLHKEINVNSNLLIIKPYNHLPICIIYSHGNCSDIGYSFYDCYSLAKNTNCVVLSYEYPNYGNLKYLQVSERNTYKCIQIAYIYANEILKFNNKNIFLYGFSLGTGISFDLACRQKFPIGGLILQSPFLSIFRIEYNKKKSPFFDIFKTCDKAHKLKAKTLFIHGNKDDVVPYIHGRILSQLIPKKYFYNFYTVKGGKHDDLLLKDKENIYFKIREFISFCTGINIENAIKIQLKKDNFKNEYINNINKEKKDKKNLYNSVLITKKNSNIIDTTSADETQSQCSLDKKIGKKKFFKKINNKILNHNEKKNKNKHSTIIINNREDSTDNLKNNNISLDNNEVLNITNNSNLNTENGKNIKLINIKDNFSEKKQNKDDFNDHLEEIKKDSSSKSHLKSLSVFNKSAKYYNDEIKNLHIKTKY